MRTLFIFIVGTYFLSVGSAEEQFQFLECPTISQGYYPFCECKYGPEYDNETNTCPSPECPSNNSTGIYPDCVCLHKNFDYSIYLNECFRVCPENSTGYWPQCDCDSDGYVFSKTLFECISCTPGSTGQYPDCVCDDDEAIYNNFGNLCEKCENGSSGNYPDCTCSDGATYDRYNNICVAPSIDAAPGYGCTDNENESLGSINTYNCRECPFGSSGSYPNCICEGNGTYNETSNFCNECPPASDGVYPNCVCQSNGTYVMDLNWCYTCPTESTGIYPNCICEHPFQYVEEDNLCVSCPENSTGVYPNCKCKNGYFSKTHRSCEECPVDATGLYPDCECQDENMTFSAFINQCYIMCPDNSSGIHPTCQCYGEFYYDAENFECKSNIGRMCPLVSIGIGPDCLCMRENEKFNSFIWGCTGAGAAYGGGFTSSCPDGNGKWPQCAASIDFSAVRRAVG